VRPAKLNLFSNRFPAKGMRFAALLAILCTICAGVRAQEQTGTLDLHSYEAELERYSTLIEQAKNRPAEIARIRASLPLGWNVEGGGAEFHVSAAPIASALLDLQSHPQNAAELASGIEVRLREMRQSAIEMEATTAASDRAARDDLKQIFARRDFSGLRGPTQWEIWEERIAEWLTSLFLRLVSKLHIGAKTGNLIAWALVAVAFAGVCFWLYRTLSRSTKTDEAVANAAPPTASDAREWVRDTLAAAERGDFREAVHCSYWAAIARLEDLKLLRRDRSRTPRESLRLLDSHPSEQTSLRSLTRHFELIWYGYRPASEADWSEAKTLLERIGCLAGSTAPTASS
jgi:Domain of unknown function (DUF4129)